MKKIFLAAALLLTSATWLTAGAQAYKPTADNLKAREDFEDMKFGIFIHWGLYATYAQGEWYMERGKVNKDEYAQAAKSFYPICFNADEWLKAFKDAGARYITFTSRHHEGFSMFDTKATDYSIVKATPFKRDVVGELAKACKKEGLSLHLYYSITDWIREDFPIGGSGKFSGRKGDHADYPHYFKFMEDQIGELLRNYGPIGAMWFDGYWDHPDNKEKFDWKMPELYRYIHSIQPACLIGNNHHRAIIDGEDFQMFERDLPGQNKEGYNDAEVSSNVPLEMCQTMNTEWGYKVTDLKYKSVAELVHLLVRNASMGSNLLLNVGPRGNGTLPDSALNRLKGIGQYLRANGKSIYATRRGLVPEQPWGVSTTAKDGRTLYLHFIAPDSVQGGTVTFPLARKAVRATTLVGGKPVALKWKKGKATLSGLVLPKDNIDTVVAIELKSK